MLAGVDLQNLRRLEPTDLVYDSRLATPGCLFFCISGEKDDGHRYAADAVAAGAVAVVCERPLDLDVPQLVVPSAREAMSGMASEFYRDPSRDLTLIGITGTNGKTTTAYLIHSIARAAGDPGGLIGTIETRIGDEVHAGARTTPESADLQRSLRKMADARVRVCAMEVTSEGIAAGRVEGTWFSLAMFLNLTQDHLDFHVTMENYYSAKKTLFDPARCGRALINIEDPWGERLCNEVGVESSTFGLGRGDLVAERLQTGPGGSRFIASGLGMELEVEVNMPGLFNAANALAAAGAAHLAGLPADAIVKGLSDLRRVPGRFEMVEESQDFSVIVDYAHTPNALVNALAGARGIAELKQGRLIVVFGCGGDRDAAKRPLMGEAAARGADVVLVTSDNPRSEDPESIIRQIEKGITVAPPPGGYLAIAGRAEAIEAALAEAKPGDVVLIAGKGHETGQQFADRTVPFDDRQVASELLRRMVGGSYK
jgi:UDP-N-acetylmuramoyl-L-alanyl-D-glutamate--2,6-diaminopimelate ligase